MSRVIDSDGSILVALARYGGRSVAAPDTLTSGDIGTYIFVTSSGTITLPAISDTTSFVPVVVKNISAGPVVIDGDGSELIDDDPTLTLLYTNSAVWLVSDGVQWRKV